MLTKTVYSTLFPWRPENQSRPALPLPSEDVSINVEDIQDSSGFKPRRPPGTPFIPPDVRNLGQPVEDPATPAQNPRMVAQDQAWKLANANRDDYNNMPHTSGSPLARPLDQNQVQAALQSLGSPQMTVEAPNVGMNEKDEKRRAKEAARPKFTPDPNASPEENALAQAQFMQQNPVNMDRGIGGLIREILGNFSYGLSKTQPGMSPWQALALGGAGAAGTFDRTWNERRNAEEQIPGLMKNVEFANQQKLKNTQAQTILNDDKRADDNLKRQIDADKSKEDYWRAKVDQGNWRLASNDELMALRDKWMSSKDSNDKRRLNLVEAEMENRNRRDAANRASREKIATERIESNATAAAKRIEARTPAEQERLFQALDKQAAELGLSPEEVQARKDAYLAKIAKATAPATRQPQPRPKRR